MLRSTLSRLSSYAVPVLAAGMIGCSGVSADWVKAGATPQQVKADNAACRAEAEQAYGVTANITHDIRAARRGGQPEVNRQSDAIRSYDTEQKYDNLFDACMAARGYSKNTGR